MTRLVLILFTILVAPLLAAQEPLFDDWENWTLRESAAENFSLRHEPGGTVLRVSGDSGWLQSPGMYEDFVLRGEFRFLEADSDSGIFLRVEPATDFFRGWPGDAYQVQIREISVNDSDNPLPLLNLYRHRVPEGETRYERERVFDLYSGVGEWQAIEIIVTGSSLQASLNGEAVLSAQGLDNLRGYLGFQSEKGVIEFRNLEIENR